MSKKFILRGTTFITEIIGAFEDRESAEKAQERAMAGDRKGVLTGGIPESYTYTCSIDVEDYPEEEDEAPKDVKETQKPIILICGKTCSGKSTVADEMAKQYGLKIIQSFTTRQKRSQNETGHAFISAEQARILLGDKSYREKIIAMNEFDGNKYWITKEQWDAGDIYVVDPETGYDLCKKYGSSRNIIFVYIRCNLVTRSFRAAQRGMSQKEFDKRLTEEFGWDIFWSEVVNDCESNYMLPAIIVEHTNEHEGDIADTVKTIYATYDLCC